MLNESSVACLTVNQNLTSVTNDDCSGMKVENYVGYCSIIALDNQNQTADVSHSFMRKRNMVKKKILLIETVDSFIGTETDIFKSHLLKLEIPKSALYATKNKRKRQKGMFNLTPKFNLLRWNHICYNI
ncbi:hypothetical protein J0S82_017741, partial [Galemys pyrenaicus]